MHCVEVVGSFGKSKFEVSVFGGGDDDAPEKIQTRLYSSREKGSVKGHNKAHV